ncbi:ATP-binding protein [Desulfosarcina ovata subsp. sediminis]|uniref:ATP-binding protein n=1 Tax=Desulfosarcina ovata subsp. sediminis TaxID=885957 RepID=A0A5K7ZE91_9BACT|nr:SbcC/MukB-like Walker B domain-containing protein [Desulfosarcina ovata]BBO80362.1 ATP-binding protein [Desulfosarcina ovata subsp. sediminis]
MQQLIDISESNAHAGFRLQTFDVLNWGTFHRHVWTLPTGGSNSLLTGDIGSGKSTLVDGLTTLLVPPQQVVYNKAAGAETRERDLRSYVMGFYKSEKNAETLEASAVALRDQNSFSVLLAVFANAGYRQAVTLAMVLWLPDKGRPPERFYVVADEVLRIKDDFSGFGEDIRELKKGLKKRKKVRVFDAFTKYSAAFMRRMGIESSQALHLFFQTVSMKSVGNLTDFVRRHMLEAPPVKERIEALCHQFEDLNQAHAAVLRARDQVAQLEPLVAECDAHAKITAEIAVHIEYREVLHAFFAAKKVRLLDERIAIYETEQHKRTAQLERVRQQLEALKQHEHQLRQAIFENGGNRLAELSATIERLTIDRTRIQQRAEAYLAICRELSLPRPNNDERFLANRTAAQKRLADVDARVAETENRQVETKVRLKELGAGISDLEAELASLKKRKSNIPLKNITIRKRLCEALGVPEATIPFCGELLRIRETEKAWEGAAERLLRNFGLSLLVPEKWYGPVADHVNSHHLAGRIVYYKTVIRGGASDLNVDPRALCRKLEIKPDTPFYDWLEAELFRRFNAVCCDDLTDFQRLPFAVTRQGQIKSAGKRHEKDDRFAIHDRSRFILGWQNLEKIASLDRDLKRLQDQWDAAIDALQKSETIRQQLRREEDQLRSLLRIDRFGEINWQILAMEINRLSQEKAALQESADILRTLHAQLSENQTAMAGWEEKKEKVIADLSRIQDRLKTGRDDRREAQTRLDAVPEARRRELFPALRQLQAEALPDVKITARNCDARQTEMRDWLQTRIDALNKKQERRSQTIVRLMQAYKNAYPLQTRETDAAVAAAGEYARMLESLVQEDLPRHERRFKTMLNEGTIQNMALFQSKLESELADIRDKIDVINGSLSAIDYNDGSYITLMADQSRNTDVRQFRQDLKACLGGTLTGNADEDYNENKFLQVKAIIDRFRGRDGRTDLDHRWTRKVTDVRNWLVFSVAERWREDDAEKEFFSDTSGKSGGQKEKLAYTILAAALAYQFGLKWGEKRSRAFRFVMIDEAFGRGSDDSTRYALELFGRLNLQLLIVTPMQKTHIIEDYVRSVHFIHNEGGCNSMIRNLTIEEYREEKAAFQRVGT